MTDHISLSAFLAPLTAAIKSVAVSAWVAAEISEIRDNHHVYITLIETDDAGTKVAELRASLWASGKQKLLDRFAEGTGGERLRKGIKVLLKLKPALHPLYGLTATVEGVDPTYTLGDAERKLLELRQRLISEGAYDRQRLFPQPTDFMSVAVISPAGAAGEGDFRSHADPLQAAGLCQFTYYTATFQGERASPEIVSALRAVFMAHRLKAFDAVIILRGGGAQSDLAWLNDYEISNAISKMPLPVLVAIGHERDVTILDEIANVSFHTPSKAIGYVTSCIFDNAREALKAFEFIVASVTKTHALASLSIDRAREAIHTASAHEIRVAIDRVVSDQNSITAGARHAIELSQAGVEQALETLKDSARRQLKVAARETDAGVNDVVGGANRMVASVEHGMGRAREVIHGTAMKAIAVAENQIEGWRLLTRDRAYLGHKMTTDSMESVIEVIHAAAASDVAAVETDIDGQRSLIRDRSFLAVRNIGDRLKASAEFVVGLGPEKTLQRGFVLARHRDGQPVTRRVQVSAGEQIQLQFADGNVGATTE